MGSQAARHGGRKITRITVNQLCRICRGLSSLVGLIRVIDRDVSLQVFLGLKRFTAVGTSPGDIISHKSFTVSRVRRSLPRGCVAGSDMFPDLELAGDHVVTDTAAVLQAHVDLLQVGVVLGELREGLPAKSALARNLLCLLRLVEYQHGGMLASDMINKT